MNMTTYRFDVIFKGSKEVILCDLQSLRSLCVNFHFGRGLQKEVNSF